MWVRITAVRVVGVASFLGAAFGVGGRFGLGDLNIAFFLKLGDELLNNIDLEVVENIYSHICQSSSG
jgi:hypothetical protein